MNSWRIHFGWAIATVLTAVVSARIASRQEPEPVREPAPLRSAPVAEAAKPVAVPASVELAEAPVSLPVEPAPDLERLLALVRSTTDFEKLKKILEGIPVRAMKLKVLREAACSKDARAFYAAIEVLRQMKGRDVAEVVEASLAVQKDRGYGEYAAELLGEIGDALSYTPLAEALGSANEAVRINSADTLKKLGYPAPAQDLVTVYTRQFESPDGSLRRKSVETLIQLNLEGSIGVFARALKDSNGDVRAEAINAFTKLDRKEYLPLLEPLVNDPHPEVAKEAKDAVESLKEEK